MQKLKEDYYGTNDISKFDPSYLEKYFGNLTLVVIERDMPVGERLSDIYAWLELPEKNIVRIQAAFKRLQFKDGLKLDATSQADIEKYEYEFLPKKMGNFLGKFHSLHLVHVTTDDKNWLASGDLRDLDSILGAQIDGFVPTENDYMGDPSVH